jgi:hypothetical protein
MDNDTRGPLFGMVAVCVVLLVLLTRQNLSTTPIGESAGYRLGLAITPPFLMVVGLLVFLAVVAVGYLVTARTEAVTFRQAFLNWPLVCLGAAVALLLVSGVI